MNAPARLALFGAGLAAAFGVAAGVGAAAGPIQVGGGDDHDADHASAPTPPVPIRLVADEPVVPAGEPFHYAFTVEGADGPIVDFDGLYLFVVSDDHAGIWHLATEMNATGTWHVDMPALAAGTYSVYVEASPTGAEHRTLRGSITVAASGETPIPTVAPGDGPHEEHGS